MTFKLLDEVGDLDLKKALYFSLSVHLFLVLLAYLFSSISFSWIRSHFQPKLMNTAVRVDVVGMPKYSLQELKSMKLPTLATEVKTTHQQKAATSSTFEGAYKADDEYKKLNKTKKLNDILANLSKKKIIKQAKNAKGANEENESDSKTLSTEQINKLVLEGNKVSKGTALVGDSSDEVMMEFAQYANTIPDLIRKHWRLPTYLMNNENLKCRIRIYISSDGKLLKAEVYEGSGVDEYDQKALRAVKDVKAFPTPSKAIVHRVSSGDLLLGFPL